MAKYLVIVESPAKAKTIEKFLGSGYTVKASMGHIRDLPKRELGVDIENDFRPKYITIRGKGKVLKAIKQTAEKADKVYLAADRDREGEAIAWHLANYLKLDKKAKCRLIFNEITKKAIQESLHNPKAINIDKVNAQQARRILDRLVGYKLSPFLWKKVRKGLSAGRVQSVAVRLICEREREIINFVPEEYWTIHAKLEKPNFPPPFEATLIKIKNRKAKIKSKKEADEIVTAIKKEEFKVSKIQKRDQKRRPSAPFTTSTMQQEANRRLGFTARRTMSIAQQLYEGLDIGKEGSVGLITYMRTDSTHISSSAQAEARKYIEENYGGDYRPAKPFQYKSRRRAQEAHEAIRPTSVYREPKSIRKYLNDDQYRLYELIWRRFVASQMNPAIFEVITVDISAGDYLFRASSSTLKFPGFLKIYKWTKDEEKEEEASQQLPPLEKGDLLRLLDLIANQHFTKPPSRYTEATLVKALEEKGIGRPSTYAEIINIIQERGYVVKEQRQLKPTDLGFDVTDLLIKGFPDVISVEFTANMEDQLDDIEGAKVDWIEVLKDFYDPFSDTLERAQKELPKVEIDSGIKCDKCGKPMVIKYGRYGKFLACSGYPECKNTRDIRENGTGEVEIIEEEELEETCDKCGRPMVVKVGRYGRFLACTGYPECKNTKPLTKDASGKLKVEEEEVTDEICEKCGSPLVVKRGRYGKFLGCSRYPECDFMKPIDSGFPCPREGCDGHLIQRRGKRGKLFYGCSRYPQCDYTLWGKPIEEECPKCGSPFLVEKIDRKKGEIRVHCPKEDCNYSYKRPLEVAKTKL